MANCIKKENLIKIFIIANLLALFESIIYTFLVNDSSYFSIGQMNTDPGGDFYLSLLFSSKLTPYKYDTFPYPPFIVLFCYIMNFICHDNILQMIEGMSWADARLKVYSEIFAFKNANLILSIIVILILAFTLSNYIVKNKKLGYPLSNLLSFTLIANAGLLASLVRGNLLTGALLFTTIFVLYNDCENKAIRDFSLISLAIAFNIKPYVAIFGFILLAEKRYKDAFKVCILAILMFFVPFIFLKGSIIENISTFFNLLLNFGGRGFSMIGFKSFINLILRIIGKIVNLELSTNRIGSLLSIIFSLVLLAISFRKIKKWQRIMLLTLIMMMASTNFGYILAFMLIPATLFLCEEDEMNPYNVIYIFSFIFLLAPIRFGTGRIIYFYNFALICLSFVLMYQTYVSEKLFIWRKKK